MFAQHKQLLLAGLLIVFCSVAMLHANSIATTSTTQSYTNHILRLAKAAQIKAYLDAEKQPCDNFYKFACGKWHRLQPAHAQQPKTAFLDQLQDLYVQKCAEMLKSEQRTDNRADVMLRDFYDSCRNEQALQQLGMQPLLNVVDMRGGWPKVTSPSWYEYEYDWLKVVAELRRNLGVDILIGLDIIADFEDRNINRIKIGAPKLELGQRAAYLSDDDDDEDRREQYKQSIANKLRKYFSDMPRNWADEVAQQILHLEQELSKGLPENARLTVQQTTRQRSAQELKAAYGNYVDLSRYLHLVFNTTIYVQLYENPEDYMSNLVEVIRKTPKMHIANYTMWRVLEAFEFAGEINHKHNDIWCVHKIIKYFPKQLESMFQRNFNNMQLNNELQSVWKDVKQVFRDALQNSNKLSWIQADTRQKAILKLDAIELEFITHNQQQLAERMRGLQIRRDKYYANLISIMQWSTQLDLARLIEKPQENATEITLPKYQLHNNKIQIPITFAQARVFWDAAYPNALKYSTLGFMLAHEMLQGFDSIGRRYDKHGNQRIWWDGNSESAFDERAKCFDKQYSNYKFNGKSLHVRNLLHTAIADNGAVHIAYRAYQNWWQNLADTERASKETLPLLDYTPNQLFFIGFAQLWCADYDEQVQEFTEVPERLRVIGALANHNQFPKEFKCEIGHKMNPNKKCSIF